MNNITYNKIKLFLNNISNTTGIIQKGKMKKRFSILSFVCLLNISASSIDEGNIESIGCEPTYKEILLKKVSAKMPDLVTYPFFHYPNEGHEQVLKYFPNGKILIFGYGSLMNKASASRSLKAEAVETMKTAIAFGVKRIFNYKAAKTVHWGANRHPKERAMLNLMQTLNISSLANGVTIEVDEEDFNSLILRETGYDLVPILVMYAADMDSENPEPEIRVAYTFVAMNELRNHINYTHTKYYPVRGYLRAVQQAAATHGDKFACMWDCTTYMADGTTTIREWDQETFSGILRTFENESLD